MCCCVAMSGRGVDRPPGSNQSATHGACCCRLKVAPQGPRDPVPPCAPGTISVRALPPPGARADAQLGEICTGDVFWLALAVPRVALTLPGRYGCQELTQEPVAPRATGAARYDAALAKGFPLLCAQDALETARDNLDSFEGIEAAVELVESDVAQAPKFLSCYHHRAQTVISNPPFGTRCKGADVAFIEAAFRLAPGGVLYSLHKARIGLNIRSMSCMQPGHATLPRAPGPCRPAPGSTWPRWGRAWARTGVAPSRK